MEIIYIHISQMKCQINSDKNIFLKTNCALSNTSGIITSGEIYDR